MLRKTTVQAWVVIYALLLGLQTYGATIALNRSPLLGVALYSGTYEVELNTNGTWVPIGVLIPGTGSSNLVRLDGFPKGAAYRFAEVATREIVVPSVSHGLHLAASSPGSSEMRFEKSVSLGAGASWSLDAFLLPDIEGRFIWPIVPSFSPQSFYRSFVPAQPETQVALTWYTTWDLNNNYSGFGVVADDMPQIYRDGFIAAPCPAFYHQNGNAAAAGECYELAGPFGNTTVMIGDICPEESAPPGTCDAGKPYFDLNSPAYASLFPLITGAGRAPCRLVPAPVTGNIKLVVPVYIGGFYMELRPYNHRAGVSKLEIRGPVSGGTGGNWRELPREKYNSFVWNGTPPGFPLEIRVTSRFGEVVAFPPISAITQNQRFVANAQFAMFPLSDPAPVWVLPPVYTDGLANGLGSEWSTTPWDAVVDPSYTGAAYRGTASLRITNLGAWGGVIFWHAQSFPSTPNSFLEFAAKSASGTPITNLVVNFHGVDEGGLAVTSASVALPAIANAWRVIRIPLGPAGVPARLDSFYLINNSADAQAPLLLDAISFVRR